MRWIDVFQPDGVATDRSIRQNSLCRRLEAEPSSRWGAGLRLRAPVCQGKFGFVELVTRFQLTLPVACNVPSGF